MDNHDVLAGLAHVSALLVERNDLTGVMATGIDELRSAVGADAAGVLVATRGGDRLDVLAATSHRVAVLEAYQAGVEQGPCVDALRDRRAVDTTAVPEPAARWPEFMEKMASAGYRRACAVPMRWQGEGVGALNLFWDSEGPGPTSAEIDVMQIFADILTIGVVHVQPVSANLALERIQRALLARSVVEQAKGVLSHEQGFSMEEAFSHLVGLASARQTTLGDTAAAVVRSAKG